MFIEEYAASESGLKDQVRAALSVLLVLGLMAIVVPIQIYASRRIDARF